MTQQRKRVIYAFLTVYAIGGGAWLVQYRATIGLSIMMIGACAGLAAVFYCGEDDDEDKYTVACDKSPFWYPGNESEQLFHVVGRKAARKAARKWVREHPSGQARILEGWLQFPEGKGFPLSETDREAS